MADSLAADGAADYHTKRYQGDHHRRRVEAELDPSITTTASASAARGENLVSLLREFVAGVVSHGGDGSETSPSPHVVHKLRSSFGKTAPRLREASTNSARDLHHWTRRGSPLRALLVVSVGTITLIGLSTSLVFMFFLLIATLNAIIISFLASLAVAGGFLAIFFACLAAVYLGALSVAFCIISTTTILTIIAVMIAAGWVGFFCIIWLAAKKSLELTKQSAGVTTSAISAYTAAWHGRHSVKSSD